MREPADLIVEEQGADALDAVMAVMQDSFAPRYGEAWTAAQTASLLPMPGVWLTLARSGNDPVGFALGRIVAGEAELLLLAVRHHAQQAGLGGELLRRFARIASARGAERLHLEVRDGNPAVQLYLKAGFNLVGRRRNYYSGTGGEMFDALTLSRRSHPELG